MHSTIIIKKLTGKSIRTEIFTYNTRAAEKSGLLKLIPAVHLVKEDDTESNAISPPIATSLEPMAAATSRRGAGFRPMLELMAA